MRKMVLCSIFSFLVIGLFTSQKVLANETLPDIKITTSPVPIIRGHVTLPPGPGELTINVNAPGATEVRFWSIPTGTQTWKDRQLLKRDVDPIDGWSALYSYGDEVIWTHLEVESVYPKATYRISFTIYHN